MSKKQTFELHLVFNTATGEPDISTVPKRLFEDGVFKYTYHSIFLIKTFEIEIELPEDFDPLQPQLKALDAKEKAVTAKYQLDMTNIKAERHKLLALENNAS